MVVYDEILVNVMFFKPNKSSFRTMTPDGIHNVISVRLSIMRLYPRRLMHGLENYNENYNHIMVYLHIRNPNALQTNK